MKRLFLLIIISAILVSCSGSTSMEAPTWTPELPKEVQMTIEIAPTETIEQNRYVSLEECYRNAPAYSTDQKEWEQWKNEYVGKYVKENGKFVGFSIHPQTGKLFFIVSISGEGSTAENSEKQIAFLIEDAHTVRLGEKEGSFLIDDIKWINLGENYSLEGKVSEFSLFDTELVTAGYRDLIVVKGKMLDIRKD